MMGNILEDRIVDAAGRFCFEGNYQKNQPYGNGHINDTYLLDFENGEGKTKRYILQRMNKDIFSKPAELMENIVGVTSYLRKIILTNGGDPERETLNVISAKDGKAFYVDQEGEYWRAFQFIEEASSLEQVESAEDFYESAVAFGSFQRQLADYPAETLHETIPGFHDTKARFEAFKKPWKTIHAAGLQP